MSHPSMEHVTHRRLTEQLRSELSGGVPPRPVFTIPVDRYLSNDRCAHEGRVLFQGPRIVAASSDLAGPGACLPVDLEGSSALLVRGHDGVLRAFTNACRHRATRLVDQPCTVRALVCPYHGWTYDLGGGLIHLPHAEAFVGVDPAQRGLTSLAVTEQFGLVWLGVTDVTPYLGALNDDVAALGLRECVTWKTVRITRRCNWKLVVEAFLDGYHIRVLHRDSIYRFFLDAASVAERVGPHIRAVTGRRTLRSVSETLDGLPLRDLATPSFVLFPSTVVIVHPDFVSVVVVNPLGPDATAYEHRMLVPASRAHEAEHWAHSWGLIEEAVFQKEDLWVCEQVQKGMRAGPVNELLFGSLEYAVQWFHQSVDAALDG